MGNKDVKGVENPEIPSKKTTADEAKIVQLIVFNLGEEEFGTEIDQVREIIRTGTITPIPDSPDFIKGVANVRGEITVVIDIKARFFLSAKKEVESKHIVITEQEKNLFGLMVDEVAEVLRIPEAEIRPTPEVVTRINKKYISGLVTLDNRLIVLLDLTKVLSEEELARLTEVSKRQRETAEIGRRRTEDEANEERETKQTGEKLVDSG